MKKKLLILILFFLILPYGYSQQKGRNLIYKTNSKIIYGICFTKKGEAIGIADNNTIKVYSTLSGILLNEFKNGHRDQILSIDISNDSSMLASGGKDSTVVIWDMKNNLILKKLQYRNGIITSVKISPDNKYLLTGGTDKKVILYDIVQNKVIYEFAKHNDAITSVALSRDGKFVASGSGDNLVNIYSVDKGTLIASLKGHNNWVRDICFSNDGKKLISCGDDSRIITWNTSDMNNIYLLTDSKLRKSWVLSIDLNEDNTTIASGDLDGYAKVIGRFASYKVRMGVPVQKILFKPNEKIYMKIAIATRGKGVILVDSKKMKSNSD
jgi:WD40 repeat protein